MVNGSFAACLSSSLSWPLCASGVITGKRRGGKTSLLAFIADGFPGSVLTLYPRGPARRNVDNIIRHLESTGSRVSTSSDPEVREILAGILDSREPLDRTLLVLIDEIHRYVGRKDDPILRCFQEGRHHNVSIWVATQRILGIPGEIVTNADFRAVGYSRNARDLDYWRRLGIDVPEEPYRFAIDSDEWTGTIETMPGGGVKQLSNGGNA